MAEGVNPESGGANTFQDSILSGLSALSHEHEFLIIDKSRDAVHGEFQGIQIIPFRSHSRKKSLKKICNFIGIRLRELFSSHKRKSNDLNSLNVLICDYEIDLIWYLNPYAEVLNVPYFVTLWDLQHRKQPWFPEVSFDGWTWNEREEHYKNILPRASKIIVGTEQGKNEVQSYYGVDKANILVNAFPVPRPPPELNAVNSHELLSILNSSTRPYFIYPAQFWAHKNHINLLLALRIIKDGGGETPILVLTGSDKGNRSFVCKKIKELQLSNDVILAGFIDRVSLYGLMKNAAGMVFVTYFGPDNLPPLEAFSVGCPVIASDVEGCFEQYGDAAIRVDPNSPLEISGAMIDLLTKNDLSERLRIEGLKKSKTLTAENYLNLVNIELNKFKAIKRNWL